MVGVAIKSAEDCAGLREIAIVTKFAGFFSMVRFFIVMFFMIN